MPATCPACSWPSPTVVSTHGSTRYLRCVCGKWLVESGGAMLATAGTSTFDPPRETPAPRRARTPHPRRG